LSLALSWATFGFPVEGREGVLQLVQLPKAAWLKLRVLGRRVQPRLLRLERSLPVAVKVILPIVGLTLAIIALTSSVEYRTIHHHYDEVSLERGLILARYLQSEGIQGHFTEHLYDPTHLQSHIEKLMIMEPSLLRVNVYAQTEGGPQVVASSDSSLVGRAADPHDALSLSTGATLTEEVRLSEERALEVLAPLTSDGQTVASLGVYMSLAERDAALRDAIIRIVVLPSIIVAVGILLVWLVLKLLVTRRLQRLTQAGRRLQAGDLTARVPGSWNSPGRDEIASVVDEFNRMASSLQDLTQRLEEQAITDSLTGLHNRRYFDQALPAELERARRLGYPLALLILDLDRFKIINDRHGHPTGDDVLRQVATLMRQKLRPMDTLARYGGDEFVMILPGSDLEEAWAVAERLRVLLITARLAGCDCCRLSVSVGIAVYPRHAATADDLVRVADTMLYTAKRGGSNLVAVAE